MAQNQWVTVPTRRVIVLQNVDEMLPRLWAYAVEIVGDGSEWAEITETRSTGPGLCDVTVSIKARKYAELSKGLTSEGDIAAMIAEVMRSVATSIAEDHYIRSEVDAYLKQSGASSLGPYTVVVDWTMMEAFNIVSDIQSSKGEVGCVRLAKIAAPSPNSVKVAVSLPIAIFNAATWKQLQPGSQKSMADCVFDAIVDAKKLEPPEPSMFDEHEIPF